MYMFLLHKYYTLHKHKEVVVQKDTFISQKKCPIFMYKLCRLYSSIGLNPNSTLVLIF